MCLILFGYRTQPDIPLVVAANRDEFHGRASAQAGFWEDQPHILAGRDLVAGGTWLGCTTGGRFAALTNFSHPDDPPKARSRGLLAQEFLQSQIPATTYVDNLQAEAYSGFNLLVFDGKHLVYTTNQHLDKNGGMRTDVLKPGFYGLSNAELGAEWPKCVQGAQRLKYITRNRFDHSDLIKLLSDHSVPPDDQLPQRGRPIELERRGAPCFILGDEYGTRASTSIILAKDHLKFHEQGYLKQGQTGTRVSYEVAISPPLA